jgi:RNA polymerase sigma factor (sigma-70 family)
MPRSADIQLPTRRSLISRLRNRQDDDSWRDFFQTYWKLIYSFAIRLGCTDTEAEEVVQETVISVAKKMPNYHYDPAACSFKGWLMHVAHWRAIDQKRRRRPGFIEPLPDDEECVEANGGGPSSGLTDLEALWDQEWEKNLVDAAMERVKRRVNAEHYQIFHLLLVKGLSPARVADLLKISTARTYLVKHRMAGLVQKEIQRLRDTPMAGL